MVKYLPANGWLPSVLTPDKLDGEIEDPQMLDRVPPSTEIRRTRYFPVASWEPFVSRAIRSAGGLQSPAAGTATPTTDHKLRSMGDVIRAVLYFPDEAVGWVPFGLEAAVALHLQRRFDVIYTTSPPRSASVIGLLLKWLFRLPWVAEFRDPWRPDPIASRDAADRRLLGILVRTTDRVLFHSKGFSEDVRLRYDLPEEKIAVVSNGFDEPDFAGQANRSQVPFAPGFVHLSHFGTVYDGRSGKFFQALAEVIRESPLLKTRLRVNIVGFPDADTRSAAQTDALQEVIQFFPFMPHDLSLQAMRASDALLLFWGDPFYAPRTVAGKIYEYLRCGRPILALDHYGETSEMIEAAQAGWTVHPDDVNSMKRIIRKLAENPQAFATGPSRPEYVAQFRYDRLAARLAGVLDEVAARVR